VPGGRGVRLRRIADAARGQLKEALCNPYQVGALLLGHMVNLLYALLEQTVEMFVVHDTPSLFPPVSKSLRRVWFPKNLPLQFDRYLDEVERALGKSGNAL
jgi:hypothetical protein